MILDSGSVCRVMAGMTGACVVEGDCGEDVAAEQHARYRVALRLFAHVPAHPPARAFRFAPRNGGRFRLSTMQTALDTHTHTHTHFPTHAHVYI